MQMLDINSVRAIRMGFIVTSMLGRAAETTPFQVFQRLRDRSDGPIV